MGVLCEFFDTQSHWFLNEHVNRGFAQFAIKTIKNIQALSAFKQKQTKSKTLQTECGVSRLRAEVSLDPNKLMAELNRSSTRWISWCTVSRGEFFGSTVSRGEIYGCTMSRGGF
jgi:hypothetical protein